MCSNIDIDTLFDDVYQKLLSPEFGQNLGGELPIYIQTIPTDRQSDCEEEIKRLIKRLQKKEITTLPINLYDMSMEILSEMGVLDDILKDEANIDKEDLVSTLDSVLDVKSVLVPRIRSLIEEVNPKFVFISGVGSTYPFVRSHGILNNMDELASGTNIILFFPGEYNSVQLSLFGRISDENYYRGHNLNDIHHLNQ